ncbi:MAG: S-layer homology domain-containing protein, partial [Clostridia bacterium]|nr:S-layer homology domain-containing protein [Clostridia bacterium]
MKYLSEILTSAVCLAIAVCLSYSASADDVMPISEEDSANAYYAAKLLEDPLTPGLHVIAYDTPIILSGNIGENIQFSAEVFDDYNGYVPSTVKIISLPDSEAGTLIYNTEPAKEGQSISVLSLSSLYYDTISEKDAEFMISADNSNIIRCLIRQKDTENNKPHAEDINAVTTFTRLDTPVAGYMNGSDADGDELSYEVVSGPAKGILSVVNNITGKYVYEPYMGLSGNDSFTYRVRDSYGSYSDTVRVNISIDDKKTVAYNDTNDSFYASAVNDVVDRGIMQTSNSADGEYFNPNEPVSRIDFLIMTMKSMGAGDPNPVNNTPFYDDITLTDEEKGYLSAAYELGIINGSSENGKLIFNPDEAVTGAAASVILNGILGLESANANT